MPQQDNLIPRIWIKNFIKSDFDLISFDYFLRSNQIAQAYSQPRNRIESYFVFICNAAFLMWCSIANALHFFPDLLSAEGASFKDLTSVTLLIGDMSQYGQINSEYIRHFDSNPPVRVCVQAPIAFPIVMSAIGHLGRNIKSDRGKIKI